MAAPETPGQMNHARTDVSCVTAPLPPEAAWEAEALLLRIFEYGDYSLRSALSGAYAEHLDSIFALARHGGVLIGAGGALCGRRNPTVAILGPVGVRDAYRGRGIGTAMMTSLTAELQGRGCEVVYLGVSSGNAALRLYERLGFVTYQGIVRRLSSNALETWEHAHFSPGARVAVRRANWGDFPGVQALLCYPGSMMTVDLSRGIFSSRYVKPTRFLSVFPEIMKTCRRQGGFAGALVTQPGQRIVGFAYVCRLPGEAQRHVAQLEFYVHDNFMDQADRLVRTMIHDADGSGLRKLRCLFLHDDRPKGRVVEDLGAAYVGSLGGSACINDTYRDVVIYEWDMSKASCAADI